MNYQIFFKAFFLKKKQTCFNKKIQPNLKQKKKTYHHPIFVEYKKSPINLLLLYCMKNNLNQRKEQKIPDPISLGVVAEPDPISLGMTVQPNPNLFPLYCMKNKFKSEKRAKNPRPNILGCGCGARPNILGHDCAAKPKFISSLLYEK